MPLRTESLDEPQLNLTPMIDIVFLLIIFFMVGARFSELEQKFDVDLPTATPMETISRQPDPLVVTVSRSGDLALNGTPVTVSELRQKLTAARDAWADQPVLIRGDGEGRFQAVIDVMDLCRELQIRRFSLAFQPVERESAP
ncbi:MAG: biopolymer transporter ExbD [Planctomyces sp.]|nr:biopolymer transporter ExbD [Planctomyces sp.]